MSNTRYWKLIPGPSNGAHEWSNLEYLKTVNVYAFKKYIYISYKPNCMIDDKKVDQIYVIRINKGKVQYEKG